MSERAERPDTASTLGVSLLFKWPGYRRDSSGNASSSSAKITSYLSVN